MQWRNIIVVVVLLHCVADCGARRNPKRPRHHKRTERHHRDSRLSGYLPQESNRRDRTERPERPERRDGGYSQPPSSTQQQQQPQTHSRKAQQHSASHSTTQHHRRRHHHHHHEEEEQECPNCYQLEVRKNVRIAQIKDRVLTATGLIRPPNMTGVVISSNPDVQSIIQDMESAAPVTSYLHGPLYNDEEPDVKTKIVFSPIEPAPPDLNIPEGTFVLYFNLGIPELGSRARRAILHVWLKPATSDIRQVPVSVYKVSRPLRPGGVVEMKPVTTVMESFNPHNGNWVKIEVYQLLQEWLTRPEENLGLIVEATDSQGQQVVVTDPSEFPSNAPLLEIHTEDSNRSRSRRNSGNVVCNNKNESRCCLYNLTVNFVELGWDFIVAPKAYEANFCNGECPFLYAHKYAHTALVQKVNLTNPKHGPCCGARKLSSIQMLYYDHEHKIKFDIIQNMVVDRCGCS